MPQSRNNDRVMYHSLVFSFISFIIFTIAVFILLKLFAPIYPFLLYQPLLLLFKTLAVINANLSLQELHA